MAIQKDKLTVRVTFFEEVLGTCANDPEIHDNFIAHNAPDAPSRAEEIEALGTGEVIERGMTVFPRMEDKLTPFIWDYQIKGFFKDSCSALRSVQGSESKKIKADKRYRSKITAGSAIVSDRCAVRRRRVSGSPWHIRRRCLPVRLWSSRSCAISTKSMTCRRS